MVYSYFYIDDLSDDVDNINEQYTVKQYEKIFFDFDNRTFDFEKNNNFAVFINRGLFSWL